VWSVRLCSLMSAMQSGTGVEVTMKMSRAYWSSLTGKVWWAFQYFCAACARIQSSARVVAVRNISLSVGELWLSLDLLGLSLLPSSQLPIAL
jgi:hypothetical protein